MDEQIIMEDKPLISVVVPIYKVENYLEDCVESITAQTYDNLEIILVDDGSPDRCGDLADNLAKRPSFKSNTQTKWRVIVS